LVIADWYNEEIIDKLTFFDEKSKQWWIPVTGGSNLPAVNDLLSKYKISFGKTVYDGRASIGDSIFYFASGAGISTFPKNGILIPFELSDQSQEILENKKEIQKVPIIGLYEIPPELSDSLSPPDQNQANNHTGRIVVFGDSSCLDSSNKLGYGMCFGIIKELLLYTSKGIVSNDFSKHPILSEDYVSKKRKLPERIPGNKLADFSKVINKKSECIERSFIYVNETYENNPGVIQGNPGVHKTIFREFKSFISSSHNNMVNLPNWIILGVIIFLVVLFYFIYNNR